MKLVNICPEAVQSGLVQTLPACQINTSNSDQSVFWTSSVIDRLVL